jgi:glycosyltransferase involved in cell wall biosynthesis
MDRIRREFPNALLIITEPEENGARGDDRRNDRDELFRTIESLDLQRHVLTQPFPYVDMPWVYNECDVVIYPTIGEEPFGLVPVEAMACERPVVVSRSGGLVETVVDGETGFIVEKEDADALAERVLTLLRDRELAAGMGRAGRERAVQLFSRDRMVRETIDLYQDARRRHGSSPAMEYALA